MGLARERKQGGREGGREGGVLDLPGVASSHSPTGGRPGGLLCTPYQAWREGGREGGKEEGLRIFM